MPGCYGMGVAFSRHVSYLPVATGEKAERKMLRLLHHLQGNWKQGPLTEDGEGLVGGRRQKGESPS